MLAILTYPGAATGLVATVGKPGSRIRRLHGISARTTIPWMGKWLGIAMALALSSACGRIGFDNLAVERVDAGVRVDVDAAPLCVVGSECALEGLCYSGTSVCDPAADCTATIPLNQDASCVAGSCQADGVCLGSAGSTIRANDPSPAEVGYSVALDGNRMVAGAWNPRNLNTGGSVVVFEQNADGWSESARLLPNDSSANDGFGASVAVQGDTILVGARRRGDSYEGAIYVFERIAGVWQEMNIVSVPGIVNLGSALAIDGDRAIATAHLGMINGGWGSGYVLERNADLSWSMVATLTSPNADSLGWSAAIDGDRVVLGSLWTTAPDDTGSGAIHVYERASANDWPEVATLYPPAPPMGGFWSAGSSVALEGDRIVSGDQLATVNNVDSGALVVWDLVGSDWVASQTLVETDAPDGSNFGRSVVLHEGRLVASSTDYNSCEIRVSIFQRHAGVWTQVGRIAPSGQGCSDGQSVEGHVSDLMLTMDGETVMVGYPVSEGTSGGGSVVKVSLQGF